MSDFLNPLGGRFLGPSGPVATSSVLGTVPDPPRGFRQLDPGTIIKGVVLGRESDGLTAIATDKGTVRVASNVPLQAGAQVTLEVRPAGDRLQVLILANDTPQRGASSNTTVAASAAGAQAAQTAASQPHATTAAQTAQPPALPPTSAPGPDARGPDPRPADAKGQAPNVPAATQARPDQPSIQFVGSSLRAVVVQASPLPADTPAPQQAQPPVPQVALSPLPPIPQPLPPQQQAAPQPIPEQPTQPPAQGPQIPAPQNPVPPIASQAQPPQPAPPAALPTTALPPVSAPTTTQPTGAIPTGAIPTGAIPTGIVPTGTLPTAPAPTAPVSSTPVTATSLPTSSPGIPIPANVVTPAPSSAATLQAALLGVGAEKKVTSGPPITTAYAPSTVAPALAAQEYAGHDTPLPRTPGQPATAPETSQPSGLSGQIPASTAFGTDAKQRILALFASAAATPGEKPSPITGPENLLGKAAPLPLGAELKLRVLAVQMQLDQEIEFDPIATDPHDAKGQVIFGRVVSITPAGHAVIHTPLGDIMLQNRSSLAVGARLALAIDTLDVAPPPSGVAMPVVQTPQQALLTLAQSWPTLADLIAIFQGAGNGQTRADNLDPDMARQALAMLPHAGNKLGTGMMNAMAALRAGDIGKLLGPLFAAKGAGAEREEMVRRLRGEFSQLSALAQDRPEVDWRALFLPVIDDQGRVTQVNLFYRRPKKGEAEDRPGGGTGTRFVVEADFSRLGPFQLDGLMRKQRFDLMIRSRARLNDRMRLDIEAIYEEARGLTGFTGSIAFQTVDEFPVIPLDDLKRSTPTVTV